MDGHLEEENQEIRWESASLALCVVFLFSGPVIIRWGIEGPESR